MPCDPCGLVAQKPNDWRRPAVLFTVIVLALLFVLIRTCSDDKDQTDKAASLLPLPMPIAVDNCQVAKTKKATRKRVRRAKNVGKRKRLRRTKRSQRRKGRTKPKRQRTTKRRQRRKTVSSRPIDWAQRGIANLPEVRGSYGARPPDPVLPLLIPPMEQEEVPPPPIPVPLPSSSREEYRYPSVGSGTLAKRN